MHMIFNFVGRVLRAVIKLSLLAFGLMVMLGLLLLAMAGLLVALLRYVFTGRKPVAFTAFTQFRQASQKFRRGGQAGRGMRQAAHAGHASGVVGLADVVDVQAYEVGTLVQRPEGSDSSNSLDKTNGAINAPLPLMHGPKA